MEKATRILVANRPKLMRDVVLATLSDQPGIEIVGEVSDETQILGQMQATLPDLLVIGLDEPFVWGVWAEVSPTNFVRTNELWTVEGREAEPAFPGWLNTQLPVFGDTFNLEVSVQTQRVGKRPHFTVGDEEHPLAVEQKNGITMRRVEEIAESMLHAGG